MSPFGFVADVDAEVKSILRRPGIVFIVFVHQAAGGVHRSGVEQIGFGVGAPHAGFQIDKLVFRRRVAVVDIVGIDGGFARRPLLAAGGAVGIARQYQIGDVFAGNGRRHDFGDAAVEMAVARA